MFKTHLTIAIRHALRQKGHFLLIAGGLAAGMACCMHMLLYVQHELAFDRYHENGDRIYRVMMERTAPEGVSWDVSTPPPMAPALTSEFLEFSRAARFLSIDNPVPLVAFGDRRFYETKFLFADAAAFEIFSIPFLQGDPSSALRNPNEVVITEQAARRYFGQTSPLGKTLALNNAVNLLVTGVVRMPPSYSTLQFDFLASFPTLYNWLGRGFIESWQNNTCQTYVLLGGNASLQAVSARFPGFVEKYLSGGNLLRRFSLQPLERVHLYTFQDYGLQSDGDINQVWLLASIALVVLLVASVNFINLSTARLALRAKEVGVKKLMGASRGSLVRQFLGETGLLAGGALLAAIVLVELTMPFIDAMTGKGLAGFSSEHWQVWLAPVGIAISVSLLAGCYPAFVLASLSPIQSLKGSLTSGRKRAFFRRGLVVFQFALTVMLVVGAWIIQKQMSFLEMKELGLVKDHVLVIPIRDENLRQNYETLKNRLRRQAGVLQASAAGLLPGGPVGKTPFQARGTAGTISMLWVDQDFVKTLGITMLAGRDFPGAGMSNAEDSFILNEEAVRQIGWSGPEEAVGKSFELAEGKKGTIIGVTKDFNFASLHRKIDPLIMRPWRWMNYMLVRVDPSAGPGILSELKRIWQDADPVHPFTYTFLEENFGRHLQADRRLGEVFGCFALLAIAMACSGLFSLVTLTTEQRTKEIGIRKVLGASVAGIMGLLTKEIVVLVLLANVIAWPIAYYMMRIWLHGFAYQVDIGIGAFLLSAEITLAVAWLTVSYQSAKAALANPVDALRYE